MFAYWREQNSIMERVLNSLQDTSEWVFDDKYTYKHISSDLSIDWGTEHSWGDCDEVRRISKPSYMRIPFRYRSKFKKKLNEIQNRRGATNNTEFLDQYLKGDFIMGFKVDYPDQQKISIWLEEQQIYDFYFTSELLWFKNREDIMAYKLKWE